MKKWQVEINTNFSLIDGMLHDYQTDHKAQDSRLVSKAKFVYLFFTPWWTQMELSLFIPKYIKKYLIMQSDKKTEILLDLAENYTV